MISMQMNSLILKLGIMASLLAAPTLSSASEDGLTGLASACNANPEVQKLTGSLTTDDIAATFKAFSRSGLNDRLNKLTTYELCLSAAASSEANSVVIVVDRSPESLPTVRTQTMIPGFPSIGVQKGLEAKLRELDVGYWDSSDTNGSKPSGPVDRENRLHQQTGFAQQVNFRSRSYSASFQGYCLINHEPAPLWTHSSYTFAPELLKALNDSDRQWLADYGDAMEFWHEVAHCASPLTPEFREAPATDGLSIVGTALEKTGTQSCSAATSQSADQYGLTEEDLEPFGQDAAILYRIGTEVFADQYALSQLARRFGIGLPGCRSDEPVIFTPWTKFRVMNSVYNPDLNYLTWLEPWLKGLPLPTQAKGLSEAWEALQDVAYERYPDISRPLSNRKAIYGDDDWFRPSQEPDSIRKSQWATWIQDVIAGAQP